MSTLITILVSITVITSMTLTVLVLVFYGRTRIVGKHPLNMLPFVAVLFCSGLDIAIITYPLTEFPIYEAESSYSFANPLAIELGLWGMVIWSFYFLTAFYFLCIEPRLKLFEIFWVKIINNFVIMSTCAFGGYVLLTSLPNYIPGLPSWAPFIITGIVILCACYSASNIKFMKWLSIFSMWGFFALILGMWISSGGDVGKMIETYSNYSEYFTNLHRWIIPFNDYHEFYLLWWFAWSIMIGQFMAKFASNTSLGMLFILMVICPSIPLSIWFAVLYTYHSGGIEISTFWNFAMIGVGIVFVMNTFDSLIRLYTDSLDLTVQRFGIAKFIGGNFLIMSILTAAYAFLGFEMKMVGLIVIFIYSVVYLNILRKRKLVFNKLDCPDVKKDDSANISGAV